MVVVTNVLVIVVVWGIDCENVGGPGIPWSRWTGAAVKRKEPCRVLQYVTRIYRATELPILRLPRMTARSYVGLCVSLCVDLCVDLCEASARRATAFTASVRLRR